MTGSDDKPRHARVGKKYFTPKGNEFKQVARYKT
jgi:hypothetical protein